MQHFIKGKTYSAKSEQILGVLHFKFLMSLALISILLTSTAFGSENNVNTSDNDSVFELNPIVPDLPASWAAAVSPKNNIFVTHRIGEVSKLDINGKLLAKYDLALSDLYYKGQGGLMAVAFHPNYTSNNWVYFSYSFGSDNANGLKVIRANLQPNGTVENKEVIFTQSSLRDTAVHYGARLAFLPDTTLLITTGDGFDYRESAQVLTSQLGKVLRVTDTGLIPKDNPYANSSNSNQAFVFSCGHRNPQGLIVLKNGQIVGHEHGPDGGDEVNIIERANNYGWPVITKGSDYIGSKISPFTEYEGMEQPKYNWTPSIAPSGMIYYSSNQLPKLTNKLLITSLKYQQLHVLTVNEGTVSKERVYFPNSGFRMRDITSSENGRVFILTDGTLASLLELVIDN